MFLSALILTAPIHCRACIAETLMQRRTHPDLDGLKTYGRSEADLNAFAVDCKKGAGSTQTE